MSVEHEGMVDGNTGILGGEVKEDVEGISADEEVVGVISVWGVDWLVTNPGIYLCSGILSRLKG